MDSRDGCPDCGSADHHGCDWPEQARKEFIATTYNALAAWYAQADEDPGIDYLDAMSVHVVDFIHAAHDASANGSPSSSNGGQ